MYGSVQQWSAVGACSGLPVLVGFDQGFTPVMAKLYQTVRNVPKCTEGGAEVQCTAGVQLSVVVGFKQEFGQSLVNLYGLISFVYLAYRP